VTNHHQVFEPAGRELRRAAVGVAAAGIVLLMLALAPGQARAVSGDSPFLVTRSGNTYQAQSQSSPTTIFTGSLKAVVESAVQDLEPGGGGTITFAAGTFDLGSDYFYLHDTHDIVFEGQRMDVTIIQNWNSSAQDTEPFDTQNWNRMTVRDMTVSAGGPLRSTSDAIDLDRGNNVLIERVKITASRARGIVFDGKNAGWTSANNVIRGCVITGVLTKGIELLASTNNVIEGCTITDTADSGIAIAKSSTVAPQPNKKSSDNIIRNNTIDNAGRDGIVVTSGDRNQIVGNNVTNSGNDYAGVGIKVASADSITCDDNVVDGNVATDNQATKTQRYGLQITSSLCNRTVVRPTNDFSGNLLGAIKDSATNTQYPTQPDTQPPSVPTNVTATALSHVQVDLSWTASTDDVGVDHYTMRRDGNVLTTVPGSATGYSDTTVLPSKQYSYTVEAFDAAGNPSGRSLSAVVTTPAPPTSLTFNPKADSYVSASSPTTIFGSSSSLRVDASPVVDAYLRFTVQGVVDTVTKATLRLYATSTGTTGHQVSRVADNTWIESTINYGNAPAIGSVIGSSGKFSSGAYVDVDITPYITGNGTYSLAVSDLSSTAVSYGSRESANPPQLVLEMGPGGGGGSPPAQPSLGLSANDGNDYVDGSTVFYRATGSTSGSFTVTASADASATHVQFPAVFGGDSADDTASPYSQTYSWGPGANVTGSFQVTAANAFGNSPPAAFTVTMDVTAPATTIACNGIANCSGTYTAAVNLSLSSDDGSGSGSKTIYYTTDGSTPTTSSPVYSGPFSVAAGSTVGFFAVDNVGNTETPKSQLVTAGSGGSGIVLVGQTTANTTAASMTVTPSAASAAGDTLVAVVAVKAGTSASVTSVTDSAGGTWTKGPSSATSGVEDRIEIWYRIGAPSVSSVTINLSASKSFAANVSEWSGINSVISLAGGTNISSTTASTPAQANNGAPYVVIGAVNYPANVTSSLASGPFTGLSDFSVSTTVHGRAAYVITPTNGSFQAVWNLSGLSGDSAGVTLALGAS
jgi:parallel beta-helix repeat protein